MRAANPLAQKRCSADAGAVGHRRPQATPVVEPLIGLRHQPLTQRRMRAVGDHDQVERTVALLVLVDDDALSVLSDDVADFASGHQRGGGFLQPPMQQVEQHAAPDAEPVRRRVQDRIGEIEHGAAACGPRLQPEDLAATRQGLLCKAQCPQHLESGRLKQEARTERPRLRKALEDGDIVPALGEEDRRRLPRDSAADDANTISSRRHARLLSDT